MTAITIIGCGPGHSRYLSTDAVDEIERQDYICGSRRLLELIAHHRTDGICLSGKVSKALEEIDCLAQKGTTGVLVSGDPNVFSLTKKIRETFGSLVQRVVPAVGAGQVAIEAIKEVIGEPVVYTRFVSLHGQLPNYEDITQLGGISTHVDNSPVYPLATLFFMGGPNSYHWLTHFARVQPSVSHWIWCEDVSMDTQQVAFIEPSMINKRKPALEGNNLVIIAGIATRKENK